MPQLRTYRMEWRKCRLCHGCGYEEHPAYYYGRAECSRCCGAGAFLVPIRVD